MELRERVLVLGGSLPHVSVVEVLKELGYYVIVFDYNEFPPARKYADSFEQISIIDKEAVLEGARRLKVDRIINCCNDFAIPVASYVSEVLNLPQIMSYESALDCTDKIRMKDVFLRNGIPTSKYIKVSSANELDSEVSFPVVVKPADTSGSRGIRKINSVDVIGEAINNALSQCVFRKEVVVEEFVEGEEYQVDCIVQNGNVEVALIRLKPKFQKNEISSCVGSLITPRIFKENYFEFKNLAESLAKAFEIRNNTFFFQLIKSKDNVSVIELGVRVGGGWSHKMIKEITGLDFIKVSLYSQLGREERFQHHRPLKCYHTCFLFSKAGVFQKVSGLEALLKEGVIDSYQVLMSSGSCVNGVITNKNRVAIYMISSDSMDELRKKVSFAIHNVDIVDANGESVFDSSNYDGFVSSLSQFD